MLRYIFATCLLSALGGLVLSSPSGQPGALSQWADSFIAAHSPAALPSTASTSDFHTDQPRDYFVDRWGPPVRPDLWQLDDYAVRVRFHDDGRAAVVTYSSTVSPAWTADTLAGALAANGRAWQRVGDPPSFGSALARKTGILSDLDGQFRSQDGASAVLTRRVLSITSPAENVRIRARADALRASDRDPSNF